MSTRDLLNALPVLTAALRELDAAATPTATTGRCARCGGATWHHQAHDICGRCGRSAQHQAPEVRLLRRSTVGGAR